MRKKEWMTWITIDQKIKRNEQRMEKPYARRRNRYDNGNKYRRTTYKHFHLIYWRFQKWNRRADSGYWW